MMDGVCISLVTADSIIIRPRGVDCAKAAGRECGERECVFGRRGRRQKRKKRVQARVVTGNWRDVVASVAAEPRLSEVHKAQSHDS